MIKANFKLSKSMGETPNVSESKKDATQAEFEEFIVKSGAAGSFMIFRSNKKEEELGIDEL